MNYENTIRPWVLACMGQFGVKEVHPYRWPDESTRQQEPYVTYTPLSTTPTQACVEDLTADPSSGYDVAVRTVREHETRIQIDYYRSENGLYEIAACAVGTAQQKIINLLKDECAFKTAESITDETTFDDHEIKYHHRMVVVFREFIEITITDTNADVDQIDFELNTDHPTYEITRSGITPT